MDYTVLSFSLLLSFICACARVRISTYTLMLRPAVGFVTRSENLQHQILVCHDTRVKGRFENNKCVLTSSNCVFYSILTCLLYTSWFLEPDNCRFSSTIDGIHRHVFSGHGQPGARQLGHVIDVGLHLSLIHI